MVAVPLAGTENGSKEAFDAEWRLALENDDPRWLSYPSDPARTQIELFESVKARQVDAVLARAGISGGRVLEYACGSGGMSAYFGRRGFEVTALDISRYALRLTDRNRAIRGVPASAVGLVASDVFRLPFADGVYDVVMSYGLLEHFTPEALQLLLRETNRVLRPGGVHIVDIIHGRASVRTAGTWLNFLASSAVQLTRGNAGGIAALYRSYFQHYYENNLGPREYAQLLSLAGLSDVQVDTCRPFPQLAVQGAAERAYVALLKALMPVWQLYDERSLPLLSRLGSMYLAYGVKELA
jgi:ubiquinone/menaquinone biosynthesis C-methylase UbiE